MGNAGRRPTPEDFFDGFPEGLALYRAVERAIGDIGVADIAVTTSQIRFRRRTGFAYVWRPGQYLRSDVPAVLSIPLRHEVASTRFKAVAHPSTDVWMHHLELHDPAELDDEVRQWLAEAYDDAG